MGNKRSGTNHNGRGGYGAMAFAQCPRCKLNKRCGRGQIDMGALECINREKCDVRRVRWLKSQPSMQGYAREEQQDLGEQLLARYQPDLTKRLLAAATPLTAHQLALFAKKYVKVVDLCGCGKHETAAELARNLLGLVPRLGHASDLVPHPPMKKAVRDMLAGLAVWVERQQRASADRQENRARRKMR